MKNVQNILIDFLDEDGFYQSFTGNIHELKTYLFLLIKLSNNHHRAKEFYDKIEQILLNIKDDIKKSFTNSEIFNLFCKNKKLLLFVFQLEIIKPDQFMIDCILKSKYVNYDYLIYFFPEFKSYYKYKDNRDQLNQQYSNFLPEVFENYRKIGENEEYLCSLIRNDSIEEFISHTNQSSIQLSTARIKTSIFETNLFLMKQESVSLIEYATFYGSIQIFQYLKYNDVKLTPSLWLFAIHGRNADIIHVLEDMETKVLSYEELIKESIKCYHFELTEYFINMSQKDCLIGLQGAKYLNFSYFPDELVDVRLLYYYCKYNLYDIVESILKTNPEIIDDIECDEKNSILQAIEEKNTDLFYLLLNNEQFGQKQFAEGVFKNCDLLVEIKIPTFIQVIGNICFSNCSSLTNVTIPESVEIIKDGAFSQCTSLKEIKFPPSIIEIGNSSFEGCTKLVQITIHDSVTKIGKSAFAQCTSLEEITFEIPSSLESIGPSAFCHCDSLEKVMIPPSVNSIGFKAFSYCVALTKVIVPSSVTSIGENAFLGCTSLPKDSLPFAVKKLGRNQKKSKKH